MSVWMENSNVETWLMFVPGLLLKKEDSKRSIRRRRGDGTMTTFLNFVKVVDSPRCAHGPMLLFNKITIFLGEGGDSRGSKESKRIEKHLFYGCSVNRSDLTEAKETSSSSYNCTSGIRNRITDGAQERRNDPIHYFMKLAANRRAAYCHTCEDLFDSSLEKCSNAHLSHEASFNLTKDQLLRPFRSKLLGPKTDSRTNAQFLYDEASIRYILKALESVNASNIVCLGTPSLHEAIQEEQERRSMHTKHHRLLGEDPQRKQRARRSLLLDIDHRLPQFYPDQSCFRFNMINGHFLSSSAQLSMDEGDLKQNQRPP
mmetsp:Transcript_11620/g.18618  ORF Transcript_11620/g.18618 Transcript_11620/m.18618 type:complete len:315 (-) Transcript_11620:1046-1990(-)